MDVGNIFKSLFRIYKTTKLPMQHHKSLHTNTTKIQQYALTFPLFPFFLQVTVGKKKKQPSLGAKRAGCGALMETVRGRRARAS